jgi:hypothetical protein
MASILNIRTSFTFDLAVHLEVCARPVHVACSKGTACSSADLQDNETRICVESIGDVECGTLVCLTIVRRAFVNTRNILPARFMGESKAVDADNAQTACTANGKPDSHDSVLLTDCAGMRRFVELDHVVL